VREICFSNQKIDEAINYFEWSTKIKPDWSDPYLKLGYAFLNEGDKVKAVENFQAFLKLESDSERSQAVRGIFETLQKKGEIKKKARPDSASGRAFFCYCFLLD